MPFEYRIHPSVGIARMGDSPDAYFIGREAPVARFEPGPLLTIPDVGTAANVAGAKPFRDKFEKLAKQGARFQIFCYHYAQVGNRKDKEPVIWPVTDADYEIEWKVKVANLKSRDKADPAGAVWQPNTPAEETFKVPGDVGKLKKFVGVPASRLQLGSAFVEAGGHLVVLGSDGKSKKIGGGLASSESGLLWKNWEDDAADGSVTAVVTPKANSSKPDKGKPAQPALGATVVIGVPNYGMDLHPPVTLYHLALDHGLHNNKGKKNKPQYPGPMIFYPDNLQSIVEGYTQYRYVSPAARDGYTPPHFNPPNYSTGETPGHSTYPAGFHVAPPYGAKEYLAAMLRKPFESSTHKYEQYFPHTDPSPTVYYAYKPKGDPERGLAWGMPKLEYLAYPKLTYYWMKEWASGAVDTASSGPPLPVPMLMDMAHMCSMSGGSFYPGIEVGHGAVERERVGGRTRWAADYGATKRHIDVRFTGAVGDLTKFLACPWQVDFHACTYLYWPASRPIEVTKDATTYYDWMSDGTFKGLTVEELRLNWMKLGFIRYQVGPAPNHYFEESSVFHP